MTKVIRATVLVLTLSVCVKASSGVIQFGITAPPPPPPPTEMTMPQGETETLVEGIVQDDLTAAASQAALATLQSLLTLF